MASPAIPPTSPLKEKTGGDCAVWICDQVLPSQVHVSASVVWVSWYSHPIGSSTPGGAQVVPPKRTTREVAGSNPIHANSRAGGDARGCCCCQPLPSQIHVSPRTPDLSAPPNMTIVPFARS